MHFPEAVLDARGLGSLRRRKCVLMDLGQRQVAKNKVQVSAIFLLQLLESRMKLTAGRTLIIAKLF